MAVNHYAAVYFYRGASYQLGARLDANGDYNQLTGYRTAIIQGDPGYTPR
jgi:hypothetical protein